MSPRRSLGQNFVVDPNTVRRVARLAAIGPGDDVVEIGAGLGSLTLALLETGARVTAIETDGRLIPILEATAPGAQIVRADALTLDWTSITASVLVANLPYNVATTLVVDLLERVPSITRMTVMVQAEVGERLAAAPDSKAYGAVSALVAYWATATVVGRVPATVFLPRPNVESVLVSIERRSHPPVQTPYPRLKEVIRAGFAHRRKMLRGALTGVVEMAAFEAAGVDPRRRAEQLGIEEWGRLAGWTG